MYCRLCTVKLSCYNPCMRFLLLHRIVFCLFCFFYIFHKNTFMSKEWNQNVQKEQLPRKNQAQFDDDL